jgi:hypothetical protein
MAGRGFGCGGSGFKVICGLNIKVSWGGVAEPDGSIDAELVLERVLGPAGAT